MKYIGPLVGVLLLTCISFSCNQKKIHTEWAFIYWMPYDNNLSPYADTINYMINSAIKSDKIVAVVQADLKDSLGMKRHIFNNTIVKSFSIQNENSASGKSFNEYLSWVSESVRAEKYAVIFLNHGGKLDEVGLDEYPRDNFLRVDSARMAIEQFNKATGKSLELLFYQVCTKGSVEPVFEMKDVAKYSLFSQTLLGAPNYYYSGLFGTLSKNGGNQLNGFDIAKLIVENEREDMYYSYVCTKNSNFDSFAMEFKKLLSSSDSIEFNLYNNLPLEYYDERYWDSIAFLKSLEDISTTEIQSVISDSLIVLNRINSAYSTIDGYSGLSFLALNKDYLDRIDAYKHLSFYQTFDMKAFYNRLKMKKEPIKQRN